MTYTGARRKSVGVEVDGAIDPSHAMHRPELILIDEIDVSGKCPGGECTSQQQENTINVNPTRMPAPIGRSRFPSPHILISDRTRP